MCVGLGRLLCSELVIHLFITMGTRVEEPRIRTREPRAVVFSILEDYSLLRSQAPCVPSGIIVLTFSTLICLFQICSLTICVYIAHIYLTQKCQVHVLVLSYNNYVLSTFYVTGIVLNAFSHFVSFTHYINDYNCRYLHFTLRKIKYREVKSQSHTAKNKIRLKSIFSAAKTGVLFIGSHLPLASVKQCL